MDSKICVFSSTGCIQLKTKQTGHQEQRNCQIMILSKYILIFCAENTKAKLVISALDCSIDSAKYIVLNVYVMLFGENTKAKLVISALDCSIELNVYVMLKKNLLKKNLKLKVCFLINPLVVKIKQVVRLIV